MTTTITENAPSRTTTTTTTAARSPWLALVVLASAQAIDVMGIAVVNTALPAIGRDLGLTGGGLSWVMTIYAVAFAGFLLFGGRAADVFGRRNVFLAGIAAFGLGSALATFAASGELLLAARALQGLGAAISGPAALALVPTIFHDPAERTRALGIFGSVGAASFAGALVLGGALTEAVGWRSIFVVLVPAASIVLVAGRLILPATSDHQRGLDLPGAVLVTTGLMTAIYGISQTEHHELVSSAVLVPLALSAVLLTGFAVREHTAKRAMLPLSLFGVSGVRAATLAAVLFYLMVGGLIFVVPVYTQGVLGYTALQSGLAVVPMGVIVFVTCQLAGRVVVRFGVRTVLTIGLVLIVAGVSTWLFIGPDTPYVTGLLPGIATMSVGQGLAYTAMMSAALQGVDSTRHGVAGALNITAQQVGNAVGIALVAAVASRLGGTNVADQLAGLHAGLAIVAIAGLLGAATIAVMLRRR
jgi:EmrB/QacA subfamily drug resistance transporter